MTSLATTAAPSPALALADGAECFASVTLWCSGHYYLQVHFGYFATWEDAEDFGARQDLSLREGTGAIYLRYGDKESFVPDGALQMYRSIDYSQPRSLDMTLDDLLEVVAPEQMRCIAMGHVPARRGAPIQARDMHASEFTNAT